jgi:hypothetical protein
VGNVYDSNQLFLNQENVTFEANVNALPTSGGGANYHTTYDIAVANVDGDGRPDLLFGNYGHINQLLLNRGGDGTFSEAVDRIPFEEFGTNSIAFADFTEY